VRVREIGDSLGVSERQLLRRFRAAVGYGPKMLARVLRFQRFATAGWGASEETTLARLAADAGYADQAHLARDCRQLAGVAPGVVLGRG
jgi:transcriptional regulator GlxA family with amidase domain